MMTSRQIVFSGAQPSGNLTIGNYFGAIYQWIKMQNHYQCIFCIVDLHSITTCNNYPNSLRTKSLDTLALYLACGIDPNISIIFMQSHVPEHSQLNWILNCCTSVGELNRMTQFKEKMEHYKHNIVNSGLFNYPILMAADILLYQTDLVPVGEDQRQHLELTCNIAERFNCKYGPVFTIPKIFVPGFGSRIMSLLNPKKKMSKSDLNPNNYITLLDSLDLMSKKIMYAITDSDNPPMIYYDPIKKPGISNLLTILSRSSEQSIINLEKNFKEKTYFQLKTAVIKSLSSMLKQLQYRYYKERSNESKLRNILYIGSKQARNRAKFFLKKIYKVMGFYLN